MAERDDPSNCLKKKKQDFMMNYSSSEENKKILEDKSDQKQHNGVPAKGISCKGFLYYSSALKSKSRNPRCAGLPRSLRRVPNHVVGQSEAEASEEGRTLAEFYYGCLGYSVYMIEKEFPAVKQGAKTQLPLCVGLELLVDRRVASGNTSSDPAHNIHNRDDIREFPWRRTPRSAPSTGDDLLSRFTRNANLVALGVAKNVKRVGNYIKETLDDVLYTHRRPPK